MQEITDDKKGETTDTEIFDNFIKRFGDIFKLNENHPDQHLSLHKEDEFYFITTQDGTQYKTGVVF